jgi:DNA invertase Pin-like site-specific DNA recombinase
LSGPWLRPECISAANAKVVDKGRPRSIRRADVAVLMAKGLGATEIAKRLGIARSSVYRVACRPALRQPAANRLAYALPAAVEGRE